MAKNEYINNDAQIETKKKVTLSSIKPKWNLTLTHENIVAKLPFICFCFLLLVAYITNSRNSEAKIRAINTTSKELKELKWEYKSLKAELMYSTRESGIVQMMKDIGLHELADPPIILEETKNEDK
jgi:hypothetical protein